MSFSVLFRNARCLCSRSMNSIASIRDQCKFARVAFHFKQWGGVNKKRTGRVLDGRTWDELPRPKAASEQYLTI
ncbi:DUF5131 family protein [Bradyrhizobium sp. 31Argb]|uniref:DUF5131 family protein n=1 Tax=Bradyrhizobium sp. 31Argb TaxID=3141247 RepID=UPI0037492F96